MINFDLIFILLLIIQGRGTIRNKSVIFDTLRQVIFWPRRAGLTGAAPARQWAASATCWCLGMASGRDNEYRRCVIAIVSPHSHSHRHILLLLFGPYLPFLSKNLPFFSQKLPSLSPPTRFCHFST